MSLLAAANTTPNIPLHCNVCPRKPDFSDISHLLTHVSSKGHLSNYFKLKVKAGQDAAAQKTVNDYDDWYEHYGVQGLMSDRMTQKERKKSGGGGGAGSGSRSRSAANSASARSTPSARLSVSTTSRRANRQLRENVLDPQLDPNIIKTEPMSRSVTPASFSLPFDPAAFHRSYAPPMQGWAQTPYGGSPMVKQEDMGSSATSDSFELDLEQPYHTAGIQHNPRRGPSEDSVIDDDEWQNDETTKDPAKLKGVQWPGMALFDSATPEMKRKRNQKKSYSVIQQLMATSAVVEPIELVFDNDFEQRRERTITGNVEEDDESPLEGEEVPDPDEFVKQKKPAGRRPRQPLVERHVNTGRVLRNRRNSHHPGATSTRNSQRRSYFDGAQDEDDDLTYGQPRAKKRRTGLSIHRDNSGPDITFNHDGGHHSMNVLNSGYRNPMQPHVQRMPSFTHHQPQSQYTGRNQHMFEQRQPSLTGPFGGTFRPNRSAADHGLASFGQLNTHTLFQNNNSHPTHMSMSSAPMDGHHTLAAFQQQFGPTVPVQQQQQQQQLHPLHIPDNGANLFHHATAQHQHTHSNSGQWDMFGLGELGVGIGQADTLACGTGDFGMATNPLFFSSNTPPALNAENEVVGQQQLLHVADHDDDDEGTISVPGSEGQLCC